MPRWQLLTEAALLLLVALLVLAAAGVAVPLFRTLVALAVTLLVLGALWRVLELLRAPVETPRRGVSRATVGEPRRDISTTTVGEPRQGVGGVAAGRPAASAGGYRLLVADVDGTLAGPDQTIRPRVRQAVAAARAAGVQVALCTGRGPATARRFIAELRLSSPHIFFDGALVAEAAADVYCRPADPSALRELAACCAAEGITFELYTRAHHFIARRTPESDWHGRIQGVAAQVADFDRLLAGERVVKGELVSADPAARAAIAALALRFAGALRFSWAKVPGYPGHDLVNVVHPAVSKGEALRRLAAHLGLPLVAVVAIGDGPNDIPLFEAAGLSIAMGDAPPAVKAAATTVTAGLAEDGLALAIERFLLP